MYIHKTLYQVITITIILTHIHQTRSNRVRRIVQGNEALISEWHFAVWLVMPKSPTYLYCGASLIKSDFAITAAHCVDAVEKNPSSVSVRIGSVRRNEMKRLRSLQYNVSKIIIHPKYKDEKLAAIYDVALLKLTRNVEINIYTFVRPIRISLWDTQIAMKDKLKCKLAGWGKTKTFESVEAMNSESSEPSTVLKETDVSLFPDEKCVSLNFNYFNKTNFAIGKNRIRKSFLCGGSFDAEGSLACLHDSGAPLVCQGPYGDRELHGITVAIHGPDILQKPCNPKTQFTVFIRVSKFARWILKAIKKYKS